MNWLSPSILAADFNRLGEQIQCVRDCGAQALHFDVMDGLFVPSISFGMPVLASIRKETDMFLDVHLMIREPSRYIAEFVKSGAEDPDALMAEWRKNGQMYLIRQGILRSKAAEDAVAAAVVTAPDAEQKAEEVLEAVTEAIAEEEAEQAE